jgi:uncharacterized membrane protein YqhA
MSESARPQPPDSASPTLPAEQMPWVLRVLGSSRFFIAIAVLGTFVSGVSMVVFASLVVVKTVWNTFTHGKLTLDEAKHLSVEFIQLTDVFLLGTVLYIVSLGLYQLFIRPDLPLPDWLRVHDLEDLKGELVRVIVVLLGVSFLGNVVNWNGESTILELGVAVALVIAALSIVSIAALRSRGSPHNG